MPEALHVLGFAGSLRKHSYNRALLHAAEELLPEGMTLEIFDLAPIPFYNADVEAEGFPEPVQSFRERIAAADALLIATPEYNYSVPGVLKNAIDWASRVPGNNPLNDKPIALMGATIGPFGTTRVQHHLRVVFTYTDSLVMVKPEVFIPQAKDKFDQEGRLTDEPTRQKVSDLLVALAEWARRFKS
jgi:chromate reductase, NAD(P)H dehydrogenase (quinone)